MTVKRKNRWRGDEALVLDGSRLGFEFWYRFLLLAKSEGQIIDYKLYSDWALLKDSTRGSIVTEYGFSRTLDKYNSRKWVYRMFGTAKKKSNHWHNAFGIEKHEAVEQLSSDAISNYKLKKIEAEGNSVLRVSIGDKSQEDVRKSFDAWLKKELASRGRKRGKNISKRERANFYQDVFSDKKIHALKRMLAVHEAIVKTRSVSSERLKVAEYYKATGGKYDEFKLKSSNSNSETVRRVFNRDKRQAEKLIASVCEGRFDF
jgi:hypothetical protein